MNQQLGENVVSAETTGRLDARERIATDLDDVVIQSLVGIGLRLVRFAAAVEEPELRNDLHAAADDLDWTIAEVRNYILALRPRTKGEPRLVDALHRVAGAAEQSFDLRVRFEFDQPLDSQRSGGASELSTIIHEGLSNAAGHGRARQRSLVLAVRDGNVVLSIRDDLNGFDPTMTTSVDTTAKTFERPDSLDAAQHLGQLAHSSGDERLARLTKQEERVLELVADGKTNQQIGDVLHLSQRTVKNYVSEILEKLKVVRRAQAAAYLAERRQRTRR